MNAELSDWDVPRPTLRLCLTLALGALGAAVFPGKEEWLPNPFATNYHAAPLVWFSAALAAGLLLRFVERKKIHWCKPDWDNELRALFMIVAAPLLLFAARPRPCGRPGSFRQILTKLAFALFPYAVATGFALTLFGFGYHRYFPRLGLRWLSFSFWTWIGCSMIFMLSLWPAYPQFSNPGDLPADRKMPALGTIALLALALLPFTSFAIHPFLYVVSGQLFAMSFNRSLVGALDQPSIAHMLFLFTYFSLLLAPYLAIVRWLSNRRTGLGYWAFADATIVLGIFLLSILTCAGYGLILYINAMGITFMRVSGLIYCALGYATVLGFVVWAIWPPPKPNSAPCHSPGA